MSARIVARVGFAHVVPIASLEDAAVDAEQIVIRHVPPVAIGRAPRLKSAQPSHRILAGHQRARVAGVMQRDVHDPVRNAKPHVGATG